MPPKLPSLVRRLIVVAACVVVGGVTAGVGETRPLETMNGMTTGVGLVLDDDQSPLAGWSGVGRGRSVGDALVSVRECRGGWPILGAAQPRLAVELRFQDDRGVVTDADVRVDSPWRHAIRRSFIDLVDSNGPARSSLVEHDALDLSSRFAAASELEEESGRRADPGNFLRNWFVLGLSALTVCFFFRGGAWMTGKLLR